MWVADDSEETNRIRHEFDFYRGQTVTIFAHVEFLLGKFLLALQEDLRFEAEFKYKIETKLKSFKQTFESNENLAQFKDEAFLFVNSFEHAIDDRNAFAHGMARLNSQTKKVHITNLKALQNDPWNVIESIYDINLLNDFVSQFAEISESLMVFILNIDKQFELGLAPHTYKTDLTWVRDT